MSPLATDKVVDRVPLLIGGQWQNGSGDRWGDVFNPSTGKVIARVPLCSAEQTARVVEGAVQALQGWSDTPAVERARVLFRFRALVEQHLDELTALVTREHGKSRAEARAEM